MKKLVLSLLTGITLALTVAPASADLIMDPRPRRGPAQQESAAVILVALVAVGATVALLRLRKAPALATEPQTSV